MKSLIKLVMLAGLVAGSFLVANARNVADAHLAVISRQGDGYRVTHHYRDYSLGRAGGYPIVHYHHHTVRLNGTVRINWYGMSQINYPFRQR